MRKDYLLILSYLAFWVIIITCGFSYLCYRAFVSDKPQTETVTDTLIVRDTVKVKEPVPVRETIVKYVKKPVTLHDTVYMESDPESICLHGDSVVIPITQKVYTNDSTYTAWVSGYDARLDSIDVYRKTFVVETRHIEKRRSPLSWGITGGVGYGLINRQLDTYIGIGVCLGF